MLSLRKPSTARNLRGEPGGTQCLEAASTQQNEREKKEAAEDGFLE